MPCVAEVVNRSLKADCTGYTTPLEEKSKFRSVVEKVIDEVYSQVCQISIDNFQKLKQ